MKSIQFEEQLENQNQSIAVLENGSQVPLSTCRELTGSFIDPLFDIVAEDEIDQDFQQELEGCNECFDYEISQRYRTLQPKLVFFTCGP